jgi:hypothetical protein
MVWTIDDAWFHIGKWGPFRAEIPGAPKTTETYRPEPGLGFLVSVQYSAGGFMTPLGYRCPTIEVAKQEAEAMSVRAWRNGDDLKPWIPPVQKRSVRKRF